MTMAEGRRHLKNSFVTVCLARFWILMFNLAAGCLLYVYKLLLNKTV